MNFRREFVLFPIHKGERPGRHRVDFLIENKIVLEVKCKAITSHDDYSQAKRYLKQLNLALGLLVNFREIRLNPKRVLNSTGKE